MNRRLHQYVMAAPTQFVHGGSSFLWYMPPAFPSWVSLATTHAQCSGQGNT